MAAPTVVAIICRECDDEFEYEARGNARPKYCPACRLYVNRRHGRENYHRNRPQKQNSQWLRRYGITKDGAIALLANQGGRCAICETPITFNGRGTAHTDHCHTTGKVRGILCASCNQGIGYFQESEERMMSAVAYLRIND